MKDVPAAPQLLAAMADCLNDEVLAAVDGRIRHQVRVVANLCRVLSREAALGPTMLDATRQDLGELLGQDFETEDLDEALAALDHALATGRLQLDQEVLALLRRNVERRLSVSRPDYL